jgi:biotin carboxyl carrier protein
MRFEIRLRVGSQTSDHKLELQPAASDRGSSTLVRFSLDGLPGEPQRADWTEIAPGVYSIILGGPSGRSYEALVAPDLSRDTRAGRLWIVTVNGHRYEVEIRDPRGRQRGEGAGARGGPQEILAPMPGKIVRVLVRENQEVDLGQGLVVVEAMKMQNELRAPRPGRIEKIYVTEGAGVEAGFKLLRLI